MGSCFHATKLDFTLPKPETKPNKLRASTFAFSMLNLTARRYPAATFSTRSTRDIAMECGLTSTATSGVARLTASTASVQMASCSGGYSCLTEFKRNLWRSGEELSFHWRLDDTLCHFLKLPGCAIPVTSVQKLSRIILICREAEQLAEFYIRAFGFVRLEDSPKSDPGFTELIGSANGQVRLTSLRLGNQVISLAETQPPGRSYPKNVPGWDPRFQHFAIVVSDMTAAYANLQAFRNWTAISTDGPQILPPSSGGVTAFKFRDPEGHPLELLAFAAGATPAHWAFQSGNLCLGIDHSAISVADTDRSVAFYSRLGLARTASSAQRGSRTGKA